MANLAAFAWSLSKGVSVLDPSPEALIAVGGSLNSLTTGGQWWRLFTSIFQHAGIAHLVSNMFVLLFVGVPVA
ncbi:rhomboid family intramembrane serine protease, partial [Acinetobacter baumannii]